MSTTVPLLLVFLSSHIFEVDSPQIFALKIYLISSSQILLHISKSLMIVSVDVRLCTVLGQFGVVAGCEYYSF